MHLRQHAQRLTVPGVLCRFRFWRTAAERGDRLDGLQGWLAGDRALLTAFQDAHQVTHGAGHRGIGTPETVGLGLVFSLRHLGEAIEGGEVGTDDLRREHLLQGVAGVMAMAPRWAEPRIIAYFRKLFNRCGGTCIRAIEAVSQRVRTP